jgi:peptide/nickel transport system substrate-binding protein
MKNQNSLRILIAAFIISAMLLSSIAQSSAQIVRGGTLTVDEVSEPTTVDPLTNVWNTGFVGAQLFNSLLTFDNNLKLQPSLATSYSVDPQSGTYTFQLRRGVVWSDGQPFTAGDVKFSYEQIISKFGVFGANYFGNTTVSVSGDSVVIKPGRFLPGVQLNLFASADCSIYPMHVLQGQDFLKSTFRTTNPVGTGPFTLKTWVKGSYIELDRNDKYFNAPKPYLDKIIIRFVSDSAAVIAGLQRGELQYIFRGVPFEAYNTLKQTSSLRVVPNNRPPYVGAIWINVKAPYLSDVNVRHAIAYAINRTDIIAKATQGLAKPGQYMIDPALVTPSPTLTVYNYDPAKANAILDQAGYKKGADGTRFSLELMTRTGEPDEQLIAQLMKDWLAVIGIDLSIKTVDFATYLSLQTKFQYQMSTIKYWTIPMWAYQLFDTEWIGKGPLTNNFQYSSPKMDQLFNSWLKEPDPAKQASILQQVEDQISQDLPELVLYQVVWLNVINNDFKGPDLPAGKWIFADSLENTYSAAAQSTTTMMTSAMSTQTTQAAATGLNTVTFAAAVVVIIIIAAAAIWMRKRKPKT